MSLMFGAISWLPDNGGFILTEEQKKERADKNVLLRQKRRELHLKQLLWVKENMPSSILKVVVYQNWKEEDYHEGIQYDVIKVKYDKGIGLCRARNDILKVFYNSDIDWLMLCDDDAWLYDHYGPQTFLKELHTTDMFNHLGMILPWHPTTAPFKKTNYNNRTRDNYVFVKAQLNLGVPITFIPNIVKHGSKPVYFNVEFYDRVKYSEDTLFCHDWVTAGHMLHILPTLILRLDSFNDSSVLGLDSANDRKMFTDPAKYELAKVSNLEVVMRNGKPILSTKKVFNMTPAMILVPRNKPIEFRATEIPKDAVPLVKKRKLF